MKHDLSRYENGKIYKLVSDETNKIYIGSTCLSLRKRMYSHRRDYKLYMKGKCHYITSFKLMKFDDVDIVLIEDYPCESKEELHSRERYWIEKNKKKCVNKNIPTRSKKEWTEANKEVTNARRSASHLCLCGSKYSLRHKARHEKTIKHQKYLKDHPQ